ncbi:hypothetical protein GCM10027294_53140 [Marinactinospora endophytica]
MSVPILLPPYVLLFLVVQCAYRLASGGRSKGPASPATVARSAPWSTLLGLAGELTLVCPGYSVPRACRAP